jgi:hypothetical protein
MPRLSRQQSGGSAANSAIPCGCKVPKRYVPDLSQNESDSAADRCARLDNETHERAGADIGGADIRGGYSRGDNCTGYSCTNDGASTDTCACRAPTTDRGAATDDGGCADHHCGANFWGGR